MYFEKSFQSQIIQEDFNRFKKERKRKLVIKKKKLTFKRKVKKHGVSYLNIFLESSSIHGLKHLIATGRHPLNVILWLEIIIISVFGTAYLSHSMWTRYQSSPTVVSMDRDMYAWNTTFPCVTVCPHNRLNKDKLDKYVKNSPEPNKELLEHFLVTLANASYESFSDIPDYNGIPPEMFMGLILNLSANFNPLLSIGMSGVVLGMVPTITEMGLCYSINSEVAYYNSPEYRSENRWDMLTTHNKTLYIHPLDGEVFAQITNMSTAYDAYFHGPQEFPDVSTRFFHSLEGFYMKIYVTAYSVYTAPEAAKLSIGQRRCRFLHENYLPHNAVYTYTMCRMECRISLCFEYCRCIPHFYRNIGNEKICDVKGLKCLAKYEDQLDDLHDKYGKKDCDCLPLCDDVHYVLQSKALRQWILGTNLQWGIDTYPRMRYHRDVIFGFTDVLVAVGGMAGLFLGCSVLSFMEIIYFLTLRLICYSRELN